MADVDGDGAWSGPQSRARVRVWGSVSFTGSIQLKLELESTSNVGLQAVLYFRINVRRG